MTENESNERYDRGAAVQDTLDPDIRREMTESLADIAPDFARMTVEFPFGDIYSRPGLDLRARQIATISALCAIGAQRQLTVHLRFARNIGITREEAVEVVMQMAVYAGWPKAMDGLRAVREAYTEAA
ncbi:MAG TPA: carboxymuconolactone decarboxylase family protein [Solirubrobacterales bacterium]|nr:carboxymuconolactone decarboxylase family protein [Solirubrobacterales bacterium]